MVGTFEKVIVVGAGPVGLLLALLLARRGIGVEVLDAADKLDARPRALIYGIAAAQVLRRAGILDTVRERGFTIRDMSWRKLGGDPIVEIKNMDKIDHPDRMVIYPLNLLSELIMEEISKLPCATVRFQHKVVGVIQTEGKAWVTTESENGTTKTMESDFVVGCDGGSSAVRKALFGKKFPGKTWDQQIVTTNVYYDLDKYGFTDTAWTVDRDHWFIACRISMDGLWRVAYGDVGGLTFEQLKERLPSKFRTILPGRPEPEQYQITNFGIFQMHQRCAERMSVGRIMLAGDAAHLCNPMGGLGLTGGIADVGSLVDCLYGIYDGQAGLDILEKYDQCRRRIYNEIIDPVSSTNLNRMSQNGNNVFGEDKFLQSIAATTKGENSTRDFLTREMSLCCDMTQYYVQGDCSNGPKSGA